MVSLSIMEVVQKVVVSLFLGFGATIVFGSILGSVLPTLGFYDFFGYQVMFGLVSPFIAFYIVSKGDKK